MESSIHLQRFIEDEYGLDPEVAVEYVNPDYSPEDIDDINFVDRNMSSFKEHIASFSAGFFGEYRTLIEFLETHIWNKPESKNGYVKQVKLSDDVERMKRTQTHSGRAPLSRLVSDEKLNNVKDQVMRDLSSLENKLKAESLPESYANKLYLIFALCRYSLDAAEDKIHIDFKNISRCLRSSISRNVHGTDGNVDYVGRNIKKRLKQSKLVEDLELLADKLAPYYNGTLTNLVTTIKNLPTEEI